MASRSFVQWRAPPGRHEPRLLHGVWVDGGRDGSWRKSVLEESLVHLGWDLPEQVNKPPEDT
jgi:hypothetical protein